MSAPNASIGRIVIYTPALDDSECRYNGAEEVPAIVVRTWSDVDPQNVVNLKVITDSPDNYWRTSVHYSETPEPGTWRWPERK